jgi:hypothetical protein
LNATLRGDISLDLGKLLGLGKLFKKSSSGPGGPKAPPVKKDKDVEEPEDVGEEDQEVSEDEDEPGGSKIPNPLFVIKSPLYILNQIKPVQAGFTTDKKLNRAGLFERPGWGYTLGFYDDPKVPRNDGSGFTTVDQVTRTDDYSLRSGISPIQRVDITTSYKYRISTNRGANTPTQTKSIDFPSLDVSLSGVEKFPLFKKLVQTANLQSAYTLKTDETGNPDLGVTNERSTSKSYTPLLGLNLNFKKGIRANIRYEQSYRKREDLRQEGSNQRVDYNRERTYKASVDYSLTAPKGLKIPIFGRVKFNSQLTLSLDFAKKFRRSWFNLEGEENVDANSVETSIEPRASYKFSAKITGGLNARWIDTNDKVQQRKRHVRELGIWTELRF